jgi:UDP:flavonoid glycosyltransferase YjiC (YdhE family)
MDHPQASPKVLIAPLDWGLGHATRCIPIIRELLVQGCEVIIAAEGKVKALLQLEFPGLRFIDLPGYRIEYASSGWGLAVKIVAQIPKILFAIKEEQEWLAKLLATEKIDAVISDNRYGLYHPDVISIFVTHQLLIKAPFKIAEDLLQGLNYQYINEFTECWVPDAAGENNLAGQLSHPDELPDVPVHYIGTLTRFGKDNTAANEGYLLVLLSGPEPQRTLLENTVLEDINDYTDPVVLVRGLPESTEEIELPLHVASFNHLPADQLAEKIKGASMVISRCGYSTVMDLVTMQKKSILVPTPGQTEQEYLAARLMEKNLAFCVEQKKFRLKNALELAGRFNYDLHAIPSENGLRETVSNFVTAIKTKIN